MKVEAHLVKAFTQDKNQGNPAGVILSAQDLSKTQMGAAARELGFSESAFVQDGMRVRFFTATEQEVDLCGHATIATAHTLLVNKIISINDGSTIQTIQTNVGALPVTCYEDGLIVMKQADPVFLDIEKDTVLIAKLLNIPENELLSNPIQSVSTGTPKLLIGIRSLDALNAIRPNLDGIADYCRTNNTKGFYPYTFETLEKDSDFHARQFNPLAGIPEDPITGVAAGALGGYVRQHNLLDKTSFVVEQGYQMGKGGKMYVDVSDGISVGGYAVSFGTTTLDL